MSDEMRDRVALAIRDASEMGFGNAVPMCDAEDWHPEADAAIAAMPDHAAQAARIVELEAENVRQSNELCAEFDRRVEVARENASLRAVAGQMAEALEPFTHQRVHKNEVGGAGILIPATVSDVRNATAALSAWTAMTPAADRI